MKCQNNNHQIILQKLQRKKESKKNAASLYQFLKKLLQSSCRDERRTKKPHIFLKKLNISIDLEIVDKVSHQVINKFELYSNFKDKFNSMYVCDYTSPICKVDNQDQIQLYQMHKSSLPFDL